MPLLQVESNMEINELFHDRYKLEKMLGRGNFSEVWLAKDIKTNIEIALKIYAPATGLDDAGLNVFAREFSLVVNANHKNLLKPLYYDSYERKPYLVLPFCKNGSIQKSIGKFTEEQTWRMIRDVASGLAWLHAMNPPVVHQDIKPDNIMVSDNGDYMITDFGVSTHLRSTLRKSMSAAFSSAGTIAYMAPERFSKDNTPIMANDVYSLGATAYEMLSGDTPFGEDGGLMQKKGADIPELKGNYSEQLKKIITKCLDTEPWKRPTAEQLEKFAEMALAGQKIQFDDEERKQPFDIKKMKWPLIGVAATALIIALIAMFSHSQSQKEELQRIAEQNRIEAQQASNDSILNVISALRNEADTLVALGDQHNEYYERQYIEAYQKMTEAKDKVALLSNPSQYKDMDSLQASMEALGQKLYDTYTLLMGKMALFRDDDPSIGEEFLTRSNSIKSVIDVDKYISQTQTENVDSL